MCIPTFVFYSGIKRFLSWSNATQFIIILDTFVGVSMTIQCSFPRLKTYVSLLPFILSFSIMSVILSIVSLHHHPIPNHNQHIFTFELSPLSIQCFPLKLYLLAITNASSCHSLLLSLFCPNASHSLNPNFVYQTDNPTPLVSDTCHFSSSRDLSLRVTMMISNLFDNNSTFT